MPKIPTPQEGEEQQEFISRCIKTLTEEQREKYPRQPQRAAICYSQWNSFQTTGKRIKS